MSEIANPQPSIVAETAVATYGKTSASYQAFFGKASRTIAGVEAPPAVWEFAREHELVPYIEMVIQWVHEFFPTVHELTLEYFKDPEAESYSWIDLQFYVSGTVEEVFKQYQRLNKERARRLPPDKSEKIGINIGWDEIWSAQNSLTLPTAS